MSIQLAPHVGDQKWYSTPTQWFFKANRRRRRYEQKLNENEQYATQSRENESCFHYLWWQVGINSFKYVWKKILNIFENLTNNWLYKKSDFVAILKVWLNLSRSTVSWGLLRSTKISYYNSIKNIKKCCILDI